MCKSSDGFQDSTLKMTLPTFAEQEFNSTLTRSLGLDESIITYDRKLRTCRRDKANQSRARV